MKHARKRFDENPSFDSHCLVNGMDVRTGRFGKLSEATWQDVAHDGWLITEVRVASLAELASAARNNGVYANGLANAQVGDVFANTMDATDDLMTQGYGRLGQGHVAMEDVTVCATDSAAGDSEHNFIWCWERLIYVAHLNASFCCPDRSLHTGLLSMRLFALDLVSQQ